MFYSSQADDCIRCPDNLKFLHQNDGLCYNDCPKYFYENTKINECRPCHSTCATCTDKIFNSCVTCEGKYNLVTSLSICVENCEAYGLTKSVTIANTCVPCKYVTQLMHLWN